MKILVTGAAGFIASHLVKKLLLTHSVIGIDNFDPFYSRAIKEENLKANLANNQFTFYEGDICDKALLNKIFDKHTIDLVIHLAAKAGVRPSMENPADYVKTNVEGTTTLLECMRLNNVKRIVFGSSSSVYGAETPTPFEERAELKSIISFYAQTKKTGEEIIELYHNVYGFSAVCLRFFTVYGPGQRPDLAIRKFVNAIENDQEITVYGDGTSGRDYTFVKDIVSGINSAMAYLLKENSIYEIFNLGNSNPVVLNTLISSIEKVLNKKAKKLYQDIPLGDVPITFADISKAKHLFNYQPKTTLIDGLTSFYNWYKKQ